MSTVEARRVEYMGRQAVLLANGQVVSIFEAMGGMIPVFGVRQGKGLLNTHWMPDWRGHGEFDPARHGAYWKAKLLFNLAGDWLCSPGFGPPSVVEGVELPPHGFTSNEPWTLEGAGVDGGAAGAEVAWAKLSLRSPAPELPLRWTTVNLVVDGQPAYFAVTRIENAGAKPLAINVARHNTIAAPFLQAGCRISVSAKRLATVPTGTEFDGTTRLRQGVEFEELARAPGLDGSTVDMSVVPGLTGHSDFVTGPVPRDARLGWMCVVNPVLGLAYVTFFPGPAELPGEAGPASPGEGGGGPPRSGEIALSFNDLWLQYGGRNFAPWAVVDGAGDRTFCLGVENATGYYANGLAAAREAGQLLGAPTTVEIPAGGERTLVYGTAIVKVDAALVSEGVTAIEAEPGALVLRGARSHQRVALDGSLAGARELARAHLK